MMRIIDVEQGSLAWYRARMGLPTASEFHSILASGRGGGASLTRRSYMLRLAGEIITGEPIETYTNAHMERGKAMEDEARAMYCFMHDTDTTRVGFVTNDRAGCSPDALIGDQGVLQIKTALPHRLIELLLKDEFPSEHKAQCQGELWITERAWSDIAVYFPRLPLFVKRIWRDEVYIAALSAAVDAFNAELAEVVERVRAYGQPPELDLTDVNGIPAFLRRPPGQARPCA